jgi:hypothetical protein
VWQEAAAIPLGGQAISSTPAIVKLARDAEFFYLAIECRKADGIEYPADDRPRSHDADLSGRDRVALRVDLDRDYVSFFELTVDHRGWSSETCFGAKSWNPEWFVAARDGGETWTVEAAVPWSELGGAPAPDAVWALGIRRIVPDVGEQAWPETADGSGGPTEFGLLLLDAHRSTGKTTAAR